MEDISGVSGVLGNSIPASPIAPGPRLISLRLRTAILNQRATSDRFWPTWLAAVARPGAFDIQAEAAEAAAMRNAALGVLDAAGAMDAENATTAPSSGDKLRTDKGRRTRRLRRRELRLRH